MRGRNPSADQGPKQELEGRLAFQLLYPPCFGLQSEKSQGVWGTESPT